MSTVLWRRGCTSAFSEWIETCCSNSQGILRVKSIQNEWNFCIYSCDYNTIESMLSHWYIHLLLLIACYAYCIDVFPSALDRKTLRNFVVVCVVVVSVCMFSQRSTGSCCRGEQNPHRGMFGGTNGRVPNLVDFGIGGAGGTYGRMPASPRRWWRVCHLMLAAAMRSIGTTKELL